MKHYIYILLCSDGTYYTGYTNNIIKRVETHNKGKGAKYTRGRLPVKLLWYDEFETKSEAMKKEYRVKQLSHTEKKNLAKMYEKSSV